jgi:hypothetical protein
MTEKLWATLIVGVVGAVGIFARRHNNKDSDAGAGIAFGTFLILAHIWGAL